jgi:plastocyanin
MNALKAIACLAAIVAALGLVACGGDDGDDATTEVDSAVTEMTEATEPDATSEDTSADAGGNVLEIAADPSGALAYTETELSIPAGNVTVEFTNESPIQHDVAFMDPDGKDLGKTEVIAEGSDTLELSDLQPGEYQYWCTVPGHQEAGMEGTLTVE